jgi:hypothetical protein
LEEAQKQSPETSTIMAKMKIVAQKMLVGQGLAGFMHWSVTQ